MSMLLKATLLAPYSAGSTRAESSSCLISEMLLALLPPVVDGSSDGGCTSIRKSSQHDAGSMAGIMTPHTVFAVLVHAVATPNTPQVLHEPHGALPVIDHVLPASHGILHTASAVFVHALFTPCVHVESAAHAVHGAVPDRENVVPVSHATWHTVSVVVVHDVLMPDVQVESAAHGLQGSLPVPENEVPPTQGANAPLQTMSAPGTQAVLTPVAAHVDLTAHDVHGAFPEAENVVPDAHATWHTVFTVLVQAEFTPVAHVAAAAHGAHGALPDAENVAPTLHETTGQVSAAQAVFHSVKIVLDIQESAIRRLLQEVRDVVEKKVLIMMVTLPTFQPLRSAFISLAP